LLQHAPGICTNKSKKSGKDEKKENLQLEHIMGYPFGHRTENVWLIHVENDNISDLDYST